MLTKPIGQISALWTLSNTIDWPVLAIDSAKTLHDDANLFTVSTGSVKIVVTISIDINNRLARFKKHDRLNELLMVTPADVKWQSNGVFTFHNLLLTPPAANEKDILKQS